MDWSDFSGKKIGLLGAGTENLSLIPHFKKAGAEVVICEKSADLKKIPANIELRSGDNYLDNLDYFDFVFRSPGFPRENLVNKIEKLNKKPVVTSPMNLFISMKGSQTIGVTGTKGKGTTSTMIFEILKAAGKDVLIAGNIGSSIFDRWEKISEDTLIVMELSSFQLEDVEYSPSVAVLLSITPDHLSPLSEISPNYHKNLPDYIKAKENITAFQKPNDKIIYSADSQPSKHIGLASSAKKISVSSREEVDSMLKDGVLEYGDIKIDLNKETKLRGYHTLFNAAMAVTTAGSMGVGQTEIINGLHNFKTLPHRMETIGTYKGIEFVDDSYATSPEATIAALSAFKDKNVVLILGGSSKGASFDELAAGIKDSQVKLVVLIGQEAENIERSLKEYAVGVKTAKGFSTYKDAIETAVHTVASGEVLLLSPACASKDMFSNAAERGDKFKKIVHELV